jgi:hypothetical protein
MWRSRTSINEGSVGICGFEKEGMGVFDVNDSSEIIGNSRP